MLLEYRKRNESTLFEHQKVVQGTGSETMIEMIIEVVIPRYQEVKYSTGSLESLKHAWI